MIVDDPNQIMPLIPKGVITAINKIDGTDFNIDDIENIKSYSSLLGKVFEFTEKLEYIKGMGTRFNSLTKKASDVINNFDKTDICFMKLETGFTDMKTLITQRIKK